jgi:hypothetical protein
MNKAIALTIILYITVTLTCLSQNIKNPVSIGADLVSNYIWRGSKMAKGPAIQPFIEFSAARVTFGAWGNCNFFDATALETDLYGSYDFDFGLSVGFTDYYFPRVSFFNLKNHAFEANGDFQNGKFSFSANCVINKGAGSAGKDIYLEAGYNAGIVNFFIGAGNGWYTSDCRFMICNAGLTATKKIKIKETFSIPVFGSVILNPESEKLYVVIGISF